MRSWRVASAAFAALALGCGGLLSGGAKPLTPPKLNPDLVQRGAMLFMDPRVSGDGARSCGSCHPAGGSDFKVYADGNEVAPGSANGRLTQQLRGLWQTPPYLWDGSAATVEDAVTRMLAVEMRGGSPSKLDQQALAAYLRSLAPFDRGRVQPDGAPVEPATLSARRGSEIFVRIECTECHPGPTFTRPELADIGTGGSFAVPSLRGASIATRLGHDGRWSDLESAVRANVAASKAQLNADEFAWLLSYLKLF